MAWTYQQKAFHKKVNKIMEVTMENTCNEIAKKMQEGYRKCIQVFYASYTPKYYDRTLSLREASSFFKGDYKKGISKISGGYQITLNVSPNNISQKTINDHRADYDWIYERAMVYGIHGFTKEENKGWMNKTQEKEINSRTGKLYNWDGLAINPPRSHPSPISLFETWFKGFKQKADIQKICRTALEDAIRNYKKR